MTEPWRAPRGALPAVVYVYRCPVCGFRAEWPRIQEHVTMAHPEWGGKRTGAGRPPSPDPLHRVSLRLSQTHIDRLRELGDGDLTRGVRRLLSGDAPSAPAAAPVAEEQLLRIEDALGVYDRTHRNPAYQDGRDPISRDVRFLLAAVRRLLAAHAS